MINIFTSVNNAYIPKASILAESVKRIYPDSFFTCVLSDVMDPDIDYSVFDQVLTVRDLDIPTDNLEAWIFSHTTVELCTAVKPFAFKKIFRDRKAGHVLYIDPDIVLFTPLVEIFDALPAQPVILTPHVTEPAVHEHDLLDGEMLGCLRHGVFNLGFLALADYGQGVDFLNWWADRCLLYCYDDAARGLFTDQRWIDLAPCFFEDILILRLPNYNVATWNLYYRHVDRDEKGSLVVNGTYPLRFFHFSGFDLGTHHLMLDRHAPGNQVLAELTDWYIERQKHYRQDEIGRKTGHYDLFGDGAPISREMRIFFRNNDFAKEFPDPYHNPGFQAWWDRYIIKPQENGGKKDLVIRIAERFPRLVRMVRPMVPKAIIPARYK